MFWFIHKNIYFFPNEIDISKLLIPVHNRIIKKGENQVGERLNKTLHVWKT